MAFTVWLKVSKRENFNLLFFRLINHICMDRQPKDWNFFWFIMKIEADIAHVIFFTHAECALEKGLSMLCMC
jgi:hypothetical protein